jgi:hypothetical protein
MSSPLVVSPLIDYRIMPWGGWEHNPEKMYEYVLTGAGVYVAGARKGLDALVPVAHCEVRGLPVCDPYVRMAYPRVARWAVDVMLHLAREAVGARGEPVEILFHLMWDNDWYDAPPSMNRLDGWRLVVPKQRATWTSVQPEDTGPGSSYAEAIIEVHSHHTMHAFWSGTDDRDEQGFRLYGVLGDIFSEPVLRVRVGVYGYFWEIPASEVFELPAEVSESFGLRSEAREERAVTRVRRWRSGEHVFD